MDIVDTSTDSAAINTARTRIAYIIAEDKEFGYNQEQNAEYKLWRYWNIYYLTIINNPTQYTDAEIAHSQTQFNAWEARLATELAAYNRIKVNKENDVYKTYLPGHVPTTTTTKTTTTTPTTVATTVATVATTATTPSDSGSKAIKTIYLVLIGVLGGFICLIAVCA